MLYETVIYWIAQTMKYFIEETKEKDFKNGSCCVKEK